MGIYFGIELKSIFFEGQRFATYYKKPLARLDISVSIEGALSGWRDDLTIVPDPMSNLPLITVGHSLPEVTYLVLMKVDYKAISESDRVIMPNNQEAKIRGIVRDRYPYAYESVCDIAILEMDVNSAVCVQSAFNGYFLYIITENGVEEIGRRSMGLLNIGIINSSAHIDDDLFDYLADGRFNEEYWHEISLAAKMEPPQGTGEAVDGEMQQTSS